MSQDDSSKALAIHDLKIHDLKIHDLIDVPDVRTVVHLQDLASPDQRARLAESFVLTDEVRNHLRRLMTAYAAPTGGGTFLRGHYGAGKSHFLVFLQLLLAGEIDREALAKAEPELLSCLESLEGKRFLVVPISLVAHSSQEPLEAIVTRALEAAGGPAPLPFPDAVSLQPHIDTLRYHLRKHHPDTLEQFLLERSNLDRAGSSPTGSGQELTEKTLFDAKHLDLLDMLAREVRFPFRPDPGRSVRFMAMFEQLKQSPFAGVVILLDELSEFLHARSGTGLTEDVRFLQFLGEATRDYPLHILAALQEYLEAAEYGLPGELVRKIKDRYPNNLELTTTHLEELIARRLIQHRPGSEAVIEGIHRELKSYLHGFPVPVARFVRSYPVHPATLLLLDRLKPLLSRSRGIVDFIHFRLKGSAERGIEGMLDAPADTLLTPDAIFDHFQFRIRENLETAVFDSTVYEHYRRAIPELFEDKAQQDLAMRLVKILILLAISPEPRPYSVRTFTHALLVRVSRIDPDANFLYVQEVLERLASRGAFVERIPADRHGSSSDARQGVSSFEDVYRLSLKADLNLVVSRRVQAAVHSLADAPDLRIFEALAPSLQLESLPLARFLSGRAQSFSIQWQRTQREGRVIVGSFLHLDVSRLMALLEELEQTELEWVTFIGVPYEVPAQRQHLEDTLLPALRRIARPSVQAVVFWLPEPLTFAGREGDFLRETLARRAVLAREREEAASSQAKGLLELLEKGLEADKARVESILHQVYYLGLILTVAGPGENLSNLGRPPFAQTLLAILTPVLSLRFPDHAACAPLGRLPTLDDVEAVVERLFRVGSYVPKGGESDPMGARLVALLRPLRLVKKVGAALTLAVETDKPGPARALLELLEPGPQPLKVCATALRKGPYGMSLPMFQLLVLGLSYAGAVVCFSQDRRREAGQLSGLNFDQITTLQRSEAVALDISSLSSVPFLPENAVPRGELNFARMEQLWHNLREARDRLGKLLELAQQGIKSAQRLKALSHLDLEGLEADVQRLLPLSQVGGSGVGAREGIEQFLAQVQELPQLPWLYDRVSASAKFFQGNLERFLFIHGYLERIPAIQQTLDQAGLYALKKEVEQRLKSTDLLYSSVSMELLEAAFRQFQAAYIQAYAAAHARDKGPQRFAALESLRRSPAYRMLKRLSALKGLTTDDHLGALERRLQSLEAERCDLLQPEELRTNPLCRCGYVFVSASESGASPGNETTSRTLTVQALPLDALNQQLTTGLDAVMSALASPSTHQALEGLKRALQATRRLDDAETVQRVEQSVEALRGSHRPDLQSKLGSTPLGEPEPGEQQALLDTLTPAALALLDQALLGVTLVEERELGSLIRQLEGRCLPRAELERVFRAWLGTGGQYVRVVMESPPESTRPGPPHPGNRQT